MNGRHSTGTNRSSCSTKTLLKRQMDGHYSRQYKLLFDRNEVLNAMGIDARIDKKKITAWDDIAVKITSAHTLRFLHFGTGVNIFVEMVPSAPRKAGK